MDNNVKIRKIHLDTLLKVLVEIFDKGVDYIDIVGEVNDVQDTVGISFCEEYMNKDMRQNFDNITSDVEEENTDFIDDSDLNQLI